MKLLIAVFALSLVGSVSNAFVLKVKPPTKSEGTEGHGAPPPPPPTPPPVPQQVDEIPAHLRFEGVLRINLVPHKISCEKFVSIKVYEEWTGGAEWAQVCQFKIADYNVIVRFEPEVGLYRTSKELTFIVQTLVYDSKNENIVTSTYQSTQLIDLNAQISKVTVRGDSKLDGVNGEIHTNSTLEMD